MKRYLLQLALALSICFFLPQPCEGQAGNGAPMGITGDYNGVVTTGGSIDPQTGNAKRVIDDLTVTGSVGAYPLKWTRILNTRNGPGSSHFGQGGSWSHSYNWGFSADGESVNSLSYPDGRSICFFSDDCWGVGLDPLDRFERLANGNWNIWFKDGGKVYFEWTPYLDDSVSPPFPRNGFFAKEIADPYGQKTTLRYDDYGKLTRVTEPAGRYLEIGYIPYPWGQYHFDVIDNVKAFDGRNEFTPIETVQYHYITKYVGTYYFVVELTGVDYDEGPSAAYTYRPTNRPPNPPMHPGAWFDLVETCTDWRYAGPMSKIRYKYMQPNSAQLDIAWGQVEEEQNVNGQFITRITYPPYPAPIGWDPEDPRLFQRTETRPDGAFRLFQYSHYGGLLKSYTDFEGHTSQLSEELVPGSSTYLKKFTDARTNLTTTERDLVVGAVKILTHPDFKTVIYHYTDEQLPYYIYSKTDENSKITQYTRYPAGDPHAHMIEKIDYPYPYGYETFTYNDFGQVLEHRMTNTGTEIFEYDNRGLKTAYTPPVTPSDPGQHKTLYFYYGGPSGPGNAPETPRPDLIDRLRRVIDPRGNSTWYEYNKRGQVTRVIFPGGSFTQNEYNDDGTLHWTQDELAHPTTYTHDEYKRVTAVENALGRSTTNSYAPNVSDPYGLSHTTSSVYVVTSPLSVVTEYDYDNNFRRTMIRQAPNTADVATTNCHYDEVGNLDWVDDPRLYRTTYGYDNRNRQTTVTNVSLNETTIVGYDGASNKVRETRPDNTFRTWDYDSMNRLNHAYEWRLNETPRLDQTTTYDRDPAGTAPSGFGAARVTHIIGSYSGLDGPMNIRDNLRQRLGRSNYSAADFLPVSTVKNGGPCPG